MVLLTLVLGCAVLEPTNAPDIDQVDPAKYEFELLRCSVETNEEYVQSQSAPSIGGDTSRRVVVEYRITNRDEVRRRFDIRATRTDSAGQALRFIAQDTDRLDPGESSIELLHKRVVDSDVPPYTCTAEVWDSAVDLAFPND